MTDFARGGVLSRFFAGICEYVFESRLGLADPPLVDYISDLMLRFARLDSVHRVRNLAGRPVVEVADMLTLAPVSVDELIRQSGASAAAVQLALFKLEIAGRLQRHAGGRVSLAA